MREMIDHDRRITGKGEGIMSRLIKQSKDWWLAKARAEPEVPIIAGVPEQNAFATEYRPTLRERFWRLAGYHYQLVDLPEEANSMPGWAITRTHIKLSFLDRLRLLISGRARVDVRQAMDLPVHKVVSASSIKILYPGEPL